MSDIPDKIYIPYNESRGMCDEWNLADLGEQCIEYTRTPIAKKFADAVIETGRYWIKYNDDAHWYTADYFGGLWFDEDADQLAQPDLYAEIILPTPPKEQP